jgi:hypothetical protein
MNSTFDPALFLDATVAEPTVRRPPLPAGREIVGVIQEVKSRSWRGKEDPTKGGIAIDVPVKLDLTAYPDLVQLVGGLTELTLSDSIMLDVTPQGGIDNAPGKNNKLRRYREALDLNKPGDTFSFRMMQGRMIKVKIGHRIVDGETYDQIDAVVKA